ncbi:MAG TPA: phosphate acyltransferase PlsX [Verrucomicrobiota bacterium]|nr:phosphate acyltransferase PlsX [Verrucomicrobiota bacterium]HRT06839.1 phosphate acyltransferase PlsX [Candidatus Paceibacterota bacterium]HRT55690.1 phosphate acyltransferase PlsX [Candidatus Paceibacterota bacterium]
MRIAVDVMGGDHGCGVVIEGVKRALEETPSISTLFLVGKREEIHAALPPGGFRDHRVRVVHASEVLTMEDKPVAAVRRKRDASIVRAMELVSEGKADGVLSLGNTGGIFAAATFKLGRIPGVDRGGIATLIPTPHHHFVLMDAGANIECKPIHLAQFAVMGSVYAREILHVTRPRVGILSIGTEDSKGNELTLQAFQLCRRLDLNFIGNVEGHNLFENDVDVVVCDGFVGNIVLKTCESLATALFGMLRRELKASARRQLGALLARNAFRAIKRRMDPEVGGGAPLLGFRGSVLKAHASARERAITNAIRVLTENLQHHVNEIIERDIARANERLATPELAAAPAAPL